MNTCSRCLQTAQEAQAIIARYQEQVGRQRDIINRLMNGEAAPPPGYRSIGFIDANGEWQVRFEKVS